MITEIVLNFNVTLQKCYQQDFQVFFLLFKRWCCYNIHSHIFLLVKLKHRYNKMLGGRVTNRFAHHTNRGCYTRYLGFEYLLRDLHGSLCNTVDTRQSQQRNGTQTEVNKCSCRVIIYQNTASFLHIEQKGQYMLTNQESEYGAVAYGISYDYFTLSFF